MKSEVATAHGVSSSAGTSAKKAGARAPAGASQKGHNRNSFAAAECRHLIISWDG
jgi:hypothetical protein